MELTEAKEIVKALCCTFCPFYYGDEDCVKKQCYEAINMVIDNDSV